LEGPLNVMEDPEVAAAAVVVVVVEQEDHCDRGLEDPEAALKQVEELLVEHQLPLDPHVVAAVDLVDPVEGLAGSQGDHQDLPVVDWEDPGIDLEAGSVELELEPAAAAVEGSCLGGSAVAEEVPGSYGVDAFHTGAVQADQVSGPSSEGSPSAGPGHASASPASGHGATPVAAGHRSAAAEVVLSAEAELDRMGAAHRG